VLFGEKREAKAFGPGNYVAGKTAADHQLYYFWLHNMQQTQIESLAIISGGMQRFNCIADMRRSDWLLLVCGNHYVSIYTF
jgi:hypothetical protein